MTAPPTIADLGRPARRATHRHPDGGPPEAAHISCSRWAPAWLLTALVAACGASSEGGDEQGGRCRADVVAAARAELRRTTGSELVRPLAVHDAGVAYLERTRTGGWGARLHTASFVTSYRADTDRSERLSQLPFVCEVPWPAAGRLDACVRRAFFDAETHLVLARMDLCQPAWSALTTVPRGRVPTNVVEAPDGGIVFVYRLGSTPADASTFGVDYIPPDAGGTRTVVAEARCDGDGLSSDDPKLPLVVLDSGRLAFVESMPENQSESMERLWLVHIGSGARDLLAELRHRGTPSCDEHRPLQRVDGRLRWRERSFDVAGSGRR